MSSLFAPKQYLLAIALSGLAAVHSAGCRSNTSGTGTGGAAGAGQGGHGGQSATGGQAGGGAKGTGGASGSGGAGGPGGSTASSSGGASASGGATNKGGASGNGGTTAGGGGGSSSSADAPQSEQYVVAMVQSSKAQASDLTTSDVADLVADAVSKAGGLGFIKDGQTVVLKPNLVTAYTDMMMTPAPTTVNGIATDWRVTKAVADLVRAKNPKGKILVMEGSTVPAATAFSLLGYTAANFGSSVDEFVAIEGASCTDTTTGALEQRTSLNGQKYWVVSRYVNADVVISLPTMKTHLIAGITGGVKNLGIGTTPVGQFPTGTNTPNDCTRGQTASVIDHTNPETLGQFIRDYYSLRTADFVVMDALQGLEHGPSPVWDNADYASSKKNMRLVLAGKNAVAVDTIEALVMKCDPKKVPHLTKLEADGLGTTDTAKITVVGKQVSDVATAFAGKQTDICPGASGTGGGSGSTRLGGACQAGTAYAAPALTGSPKLLYKPSGTVDSGTFEGPVWLAASSTLLMSDISFTGSINPSQMLKLTPPSTVATFLADAGTNGMAIDGSGVVFACSHKVQGIVKLDFAAATLTTVVDNVGGKKFNSPNDLVVRSDKTIYFTDPDYQLGSRTSQTGKKGVYRVSPTGTVSLVDDTFNEPNGITLSPDEKVLYVADYAGNAIRTFAVAADGSTSGRKDFATVSSPDGVGMDCLGNLYVASGGSAGALQVFSPSGTKLGSVTVAASLSNVAFGGADGKTLYLTAGKALYSLDMNLPGYYY